MTVYTTELIKNSFDSLNDLDVFKDAFLKWKNAGSAGEYAFLSFGKDGFYIKPRVNGNYNVLRHVHLIPLEDKEALEKWQKNWRRGARRTSDRVLVYVCDGKDFLLIAILEEPLAHDIAKMKTQEHKKIMESFAKIADEFIYNKKNIIA